MSNLLVINSSISGEASVSRLLVAEAVAHFTRRNPDAHVVTRDLAANPIPHLLPETVGGVRATAATPAEAEARALSDELIAELRAADTIIIGAPMYNFSVPTTLRTWFDYVLRAGETFSYSEAGAKGLLTGKKVIVVESRGGFYSEGDGHAADFQEPYLRHLLGFVGLTDVTFVHAEKLAYGPDAVTESLAGARASLVKVTGGELEYAA